MDKQKYLVSVIVPCYNQGKFLSETLDSVILQTYRNWECIIVNDGSTDNTKLIANEFCEKDKRFRYVEKKNGGLSSARNYGLTLAKGEFVQFLDSDDIILPDKLERQHKIMSNDSSIDFCISRYRLFYDEIESSFDTKFTKANFNCSLNSFLYEWGESFTIAIHAYLIKKLFLVNNSIKFIECISALEDWVFIVEATLKKAKFYVIEQNLALYRQHDNNMSNDFNRMSESLLKSAFSIAEILPQSKKSEYKKEISTIIINRLLKSFGERENTKKANSIDYKVGYILLFPFHKVSRLMKKLIRRIHNAKNKNEKSIEIGLSQIN